MHWEGAFWGWCFSLRLNCSQTAYSFFGSLEFEGVLNINIFEWIGILWFLLWEWQLHVHQSTMNVFLTCRGVGEPDVIIMQTAHIFSFDGAGNYYDVASLIFIYWQLLFCGINKNWKMGTMEIRHSWGCTICFWDNFFMGWKQK